MKNHKIAAVVMLLALAFACLISSTALSGEHPWDSDKGGAPGGTGGTGSDPTIGDPALPGLTVTATRAPRVTRSLDLRTALIFNVAKHAAAYLCGVNGTFGSDKTKPAAEQKVDF